MGHHCRKFRAYSFFKKQAIPLDRLEELLPPSKKDIFIEKYMNYFNGNGRPYTFYNWNVPNFQRKFDFERNLGDNPNKKEIIKKFFGPYRK